MIQSERQDSRVQKNKAETLHSQAAEGKSPKRTSFKHFDLVLPKAR